MNIWKCDTNWGGSSVLELFIDFRIVFFGTDVNRIGHYNEVIPGDLIAISRGTHIVALAEAISRFAPLADVGRETLPREIVRDYIEQSGVDPQACRISPVLWLKHHVVNDRRGGRFYKLDERKDDYQELLSMWNSHKERPENQAFDIVARTKCLFGEDKNSILNHSTRYVIPVYQRPYAWEEQEVTRLLEDIADGLESSEPKFFGSMQVSAPRDLGNGISSYELIDGQQRISTLLILLRHLGVDYTNLFRTVVNAGSAQRDWDDFKDTFGSQNIDKYPLNKYIQTSRIIDAWLKARENACQKVNEMLLSYIKEKLLFVIIQTRASISKTIQIFNVINTAGMDLNASDLFKIRFYEYLTRGSGPDESLFSRVSRCYQKVADYNRERGYEAVSMASTISFYQKVIVSKFGLNSELFSTGAQRFFEMLFDYLIEGKKWPGFADKGVVLSIDDFEKAVDISLATNRRMFENGRLRIFMRFLWETRYGHIVSQYPALASYFGLIGEDDVNGLTDFTEKLFKKLVPPSLFFTQVINDVRYSMLHKILVAIPKGINEVNKLLDEPWTLKGVPEREMLERGLNQDIAARAPWKNLTCKLSEYVLSADIPEDELCKRLFETTFDIEHIQSHTDELDREKVYNDWGWELDGLGNLTMLESHLNRSIQNKSAKKEDAYKKSIFTGVRLVGGMLHDGRWTLDQAKNRREMLSDSLMQYILGVV